MAHQSRKLQAYKLLLKNVSAICFWNSLLYKDTLFLSQFDRLIKETERLLDDILKQYYLEEANSSKEDKS